MTAEPTQPAAAVQVPVARYPDPTPEMLNGDPLFDAIWNAIKGWDISRHNDGLYAGPSGNDARHIYDAISASAPPPPEGAPVAQPGWMSDTNRLHWRSAKMLTAWWKWYGNASSAYPDLPLPPAGTVELVEDIDALYPPPFPSGAAWTADRGERSQACAPVAQALRELPELPMPAGMRWFYTETRQAGQWSCGGLGEPFYTAEQMHEFARAALSHQPAGDAK